MMNYIIGDFETMKRTLIIGVFSYFLLILMIRISGKRTLSKMNAFDFIITIALGSMLATIIINPSIALVEGMLAMALLIFLQYVITFTAVRLKTVSRIIKSAPTLLYYQGELIERNMLQERILKGELEQAIRKAGHNDFDSISAIVLETDGVISIITDEGNLVHNLDAVSNVPMQR
ncbi:uncharacterized protein DUF421 [Streptohalobacillus salinus]|uniref:Uncharacterized protein DUF421 n=1 Tax=Streptohalobacillus salinus TaxID=621096 RepID=A0A2V3WFN0_9BACI|nr:YetF domain-containing protein [Streptohalobacillus salinus]PXW91025.1 uncharacterized protein DUF421 [Streptohalobacillus salinus]